MIKLSTKGRYGTRLMLNLASHYNDSQKAIILKNVSDEEEISIRYLEQIIIPLKIHKLVKSIRGAGGGYILGRKPSEIKVSEILFALEGTCCLVDGSPHMLDGKGLPRGGTDEGGNPPVSRRCH